MNYDYTDQPRDKPLSLCWQTEHLWPAIREATGVQETGAAILLAGLDATKPISYSRNTNHYNVAARYRERLYTYAKVVKQIDYLDQHGFLANHHIAQQGSRKWQSTFEIAPQARAVMEIIIHEHGPLIALPRREPIILRDKQGDKTDYRESNATRRMRSETQDYNHGLASVRVDGKPVPNVVRIFNGSMERGGRFYANGNSFQNMPKEDRKALTIDDEGTIEIDYRTLHPSMLYAREGLTQPEDAYDIDGYPRSVIKIALLILINARSEAQAIKALAQHDAISVCAKPKSAEAYEFAKKIVAAVKAAHKPISSSFHSDIGASLMRADSDLANAILQILLKQGVVALPVHDSFIVRQSQKSKLEEAMAQAAFQCGFPMLQLDAA